MARHFSCFFSLFSPPSPNAGHIKDVKLASFGQSSRASRPILSLLPFLLSVPPFFSITLSVALCVVDDGYDQNVQALSNFPSLPFSPFFSPSWFLSLPSISPLSSNEANLDCRNAGGGLSLHLPGLFFVFFLWAFPFPSLRLSFSCRLSIRREDYDNDHGYRTTACPPCSL